MMRFSVGETSVETEPDEREYRVRWTWFVSLRIRIVKVYNTLSV